MAVLIPDERCFVLARLIFFLQMKTEQAICGTSAATYKVMEPHWQRLLHQSSSLALQQLIVSLVYFYSDTHLFWRFQMNSGHLIILNICLYHQSQSSTKVSLLPSRHQKFMIKTTMFSLLSPASTQNHFVPQCATIVVRLVSNEADVVRWQMTMFLWRYVNSSPDNWPLDNSSPIDICRQLVPYRYMQTTCPL